MASTATYETLSASDHSTQLRKAVIASTIGTTIDRWRPSCAAPISTPARRGGGAHRRADPLPLAAGARLLPSEGGGSAAALST
jgi:hypothetical protein